MRFLVGVLFALAAGVEGRLGGVGFGGDDVIVQPLADKTGPDAALFFGQGASIPPAAYEPLARAIQAAVPYKLWVGIPQCLFDAAAVPGTLKRGFERVAAAMEEQGMPGVDDRLNLYAGHSLGGAMLPDVAADSPSSGAPDAVILMGAFLTRSWRTGGGVDVGPAQYNFSASPLLTIGGEMDGLCRVTRIAESYHTQITMATDPAAAQAALPVTVISGLSHMQFASGDPPLLVKQRDLLPEISDDNAHAAIAADVATFLTSVFDGDSTGLDARVKTSAKFFAPIISALQLEGYHQFLPPCYCETEDEWGGLEFGTCEPKPGCQANSPWTETAFQIMGARDGLTFDVTDSQHIVTEERPSCHLPKIHVGKAADGTVTYPESDSANPGANDSPPLCSAPEGCHLNMTSVTQLVYSTGSEYDIWRLSPGSDAIDTGFSMISAVELKSKMKSRQAVWQAAGVSDVKLEDTDTDQGRCQEINDAAIAYALDHVADATRARYEAHGQKLVTGADNKVCTAGPCWIWASLGYKDEGDDGVLITGQSFPYENKNPFPCGESSLLPCPAGMHYCKLLSPAYAVEWMYVDSLRLHYSLNNPTA